MMRARFALARWWRGLTIHRTFHEATLNWALPPAGRRRQAWATSRSVMPAHSCPHVCGRGGVAGMAHLPEDPWGANRGEGAQ
eukprot:104944-Alexandrium_andersonii.AAC.1